MTKTRNSCKNNDRRSDYFFTHVNLSSKPCWIPVPDFTWEAAGPAAAVAAKLCLQPLTVVDALSPRVAVARPLSHLTGKGSGVTITLEYRKQGQDE